jgi:hypothetical protein
MQIKQQELDAQYQAVSPSSSMNTLQTSSKLCIGMKHGYQYTSL